MRSLVFDPSYGCAGDMILGAFVAAGVSFDGLESELGKLGLDEYSLTCENVERNSIAAVKVDVNTRESTKHRHLKHIVEIIDKSDLSEAVKENAKSVFGRLAEAEAAVHGSSPDKVHFHEVGAIDAIVDIVGACICLEMLDVERVFARPVAVGSGTIKCAHGIFPVPAPATAILLKGFPIRMYTINSELTTPTGAALVTTLAEPLYSTFEGNVVSIGYGAGTRVFEDHLNLMRVFVLEHREELERDRVLEIKTNIDDMNPEVYSFLFERLFEAGALDLWLTPIQMKKNRPGQLLTVLCEPDKRDLIQMELFRQTSTSGIRCNLCERVKLPRRSEIVSTPLGDCRVKVFEFDGRERVVPEYDSVKKVADTKKIPYLHAHDEITRYLREIEKEQ